MSGFLRNAVFGMAIACASVALVGAAEAAGAMAVGACGAYGYGFDYGKVADARAAAMSKCTGSGCKVVGEVHKGCAAVAVVGKTHATGIRYRYSTNVPYIRLMNVPVDRERLP